VLNDYPCPDPNFHPGPDQSLYDFLKSGAEAIVGTVDRLEVALDGRDLQDPFQYKYTSRRPFDVTGDPTLASAFDGCVTGAPQPAVSDGYFVMLKPLCRGRHTLTIHSTDTHGTDVTVRWSLTVGD
jgi:hypothetical protein